MLTALVEGAIAGFGIAVPVGAIAVLIVDLALRRGFVPAFAAGLGTATADLLYAALAMAAGTAIAAALKPVAVPLRIASAVLLFLLAGLMLVRAVRARSARPRPAGTRGFRRTFVSFLGLTLLNPATVTYFTALILGLQDQRLSGPAARAVFVAGAFLASLSWQTGLALVGTVLRHRLSDRVRLALSFLGALIVAGFAARILLSL